MTAAGQVRAAGPGTVQVTGSRSSQRDGAAAPELQRGPPGRDSQDYRDDSKHTSRRAARPGPRRTVSPSTHRKSESRLRASETPSRITGAYCHADGFLIKRRQVISSLRESRESGSKPLASGALRARCHRRAHRAWRATHAKLPVGATFIHKRVRSPC